MWPKYYFKEFFASKSTDLKTRQINEILLTISFSGTNLRPLWTPSNTVVNGTMHFLWKHAYLNQWLSSKIWVLLEFIMYLANNMSLVCVLWIITWCFSLLVLLPFGPCLLWYQCNEPQSAGPATAWPMFTLVSM